MSERSKELYLSEYAAIRPLSPAENAELMQLKAAGDETAVTRLVEGNMFRVNEAASCIKGGSRLFMDLVQEGSLALFMAVAEFEEYEEGFEALLDARILDAMKAFLEEEEESAKAGQELSDKLNLIDKVCEMLAEKHGREATAEEVAEIMQMEVDDIRYLMRIALNAIKKEE